MSSSQTQSPPTDVARRQQTGTAVRSEDNHRNQLENIAVGKLTKSEGAPAQQNVIIAKEVVINNHFNFNYAGVCVCRIVLASVVKEFNLGDFDLLDSVHLDENTGHRCRLSRAIGVLDRSNAKIPKDRHTQWRQVAGLPEVESSADVAWKQNPELFEPTRLSLDPTRSETVPHLREQPAPCPKFCLQCQQQLLTKFSRFQCAQGLTSQLERHPDTLGRPNGWQHNHRCGTQLCSTLCASLGKHSQQTPLADTFPWHSSLITCYQYPLGWRMLPGSCPQLQ
uniref:p31 n=1 Tax=Maize chlorotic mottle virus TaxID=12138 RepID=S5DLG1_MCMV|nr:P31 [Maize chlorotic mottle virus]